MDETDGEPADQPDNTDAVSADDYVVRKINVVPHLHDRPEGGQRISPAAFSPSSAQRDLEAGMSCNSVAMLQAAGVDLPDFSPGTPILAVLSVSFLKSLGLRVLHRPILDDETHCNVVGVKKTQRKTLLAEADLVRCPPDVHKD